MKIYQETYLHFHKAKVRFSVLKNSGGLITTPRTRRFGVTSHDWSSKERNTGYEFWDCSGLYARESIAKPQAPVVQKVDGAIPLIRHYPLDSVIHLIMIYPAWAPRGLTRSINKEI